MMRRAFMLCSVAALILSIACAPEPLATDPIQRGRQLYGRLGCASCHEAGLFNLFRRVGPPLDRVGTVAGERRPGMSGEEYLRQSVTEPGAYLVPGYPDTMPRALAGGLSEADLAALVAYLASLR